MIIEELTAFAVVKIAWELLEILHLLHVGHVAGKAGYKRGASIKHAIQQQYQEWRDQQNPAQQLEQKSETPYDFQTTGNDSQAISNAAEAYLIKLNNSVKHLKNAQAYFFEMNKTLKELINTLNTKDKRQFPSYLLTLKVHFEYFKNEFKQFILLITPPPRQILYIADLLHGTGLIGRYNTLIETIKTDIELLESTTQQITEQFRQGFDAIPLTRSNATYSSEQLQKAIQSCMDSPEGASKTMNAIVRNNTELANTCTDIIRLFTSFQKNHQTVQIHALENDPVWFPLLTEAEQIEIGQRIFLHAMNETAHSEDEKLLIAEIFLRKPISQQRMQQIEVDSLAYDMACILRDWQIQKCKQLIQFLSPLKEKGARLPEDDCDGLLEWLKTKRKKQRPVDLFKEIFASACCFSQCSIESALTKLQDLSLSENPELLIQQQQTSHWGLIWEKNDVLIQLPQYYTDILPSDRMESDNSAETSSIVSSVIQRLAGMLIIDLGRVKAELEKSQSFYLDTVALFKKKENEAAKEQKNQAHELGVARIKKAQRRILVITSAASSLFPYLYRAETINEIALKRQVPTIDDLSQVIYRGIDPNGLCYWQPHSQTISLNNQLTHYFQPDEHHEDSRTKAWLYACTTCQVNILPALSHLFSSAERLLAIENIPDSQIAIKNNITIQAFFKTSKELSSIARNSRALSGVSTKIAKETEAVFKQLRDYCVLATARMLPEYRKKLPFAKQLECLLKNLFKFDPEIGTERLQSAQIYIGGLSIALSEESLKAINEAFDNFEKKYRHGLGHAKRANKSTLYSIMEKAMDGPILHIINQVNASLQSTASKEKEVAQAREEAERKEKEAAQAREEAERREKEAAQAREEAERREKEAERREKEAALEEIERLKALLAEQKPQTSHFDKVNRARSTLFSTLTREEIRNRRKTISSFPLRDGEYEVECQGAKERHALTSESENALLAQVIMEDTTFSPEGASACGRPCGKPDELRETAHQDYTP